MSVRTTNGLERRIGSEDIIGSGLDEVGELSGEEG